MSRRRGPLASPRLDKQNEEAVAKKRRQHDADLLAVMQTPEGRRLMWRLLDDTTAVLSVSFTGNSTTFFNDGKRAVGVYLWGELQRVAPSEFVLMQSEALSTRREEGLFRETAELEAEAETDDE